MDAALADVIVVDLTRIFSGPYCTMLLADMGATVIKVEQPGKGDDTRQWGPPYAATESAYYLGLNRNKLSVELDFKRPEDKRLLLGLIQDATVLVENFRPGTLARYGLDYENLRQQNPGLIYCSISGYGQQGPYAHYPGYDFVAQAESGIMAVTGETEGEPQRAGFPAADISAGVFACISILGALHARERTGQGQYIDISLFETATSFLGNVSSNYLISGQEPQRYANTHPNIVPYQAFRAADGYIVVTCGNDTLFQKLCTLLDCPELATDERFATNPQRIRHRAELIPQLQERFQQRPGSEWLERLRAAGIPCGPINRVSEVFKHPQHKSRGFLWECEHPTAGSITLAGSPLGLTGTPPRLYKAPPLLGEDNAYLQQKGTLQEYLQRKQAPAKGIPDTEKRT
ncbi:formyl-CoA transferase [Thermosporothrix hazakensis]|jgi:formyl-CoA transferase|uniref:Formyl-CoA transferase n=1 Tax=Thermosporothrix hazakensis TaxID=644383 RepID=A0A326U181_THEHA|nr:CoA transferase [Thermosporothrix hazakensis]PZW24658.1 formyl-CoA transferase [Thermosporothrix hazakensis]GCE48394.1 CoA transferase [Thermosporothrix hazakensis]